VQQVPMPTPGRGEMLVKVHATSVNPIEANVRAGKTRPLSGFRFPKGTGQDFAGEMVSAGRMWTTASSDNTSGRPSWVDQRRGGRLLDGAG
jgi:NADPH:quinone reductase-like Zn-dependent oxidoreductase